MIEWTQITPFVSLIVSALLPWILTRKIHQDMEPLLEKALKARPTSDDVRALIEDSAKKAEDAVRREYVNKEAFARMEARLDAVASKESVVRLSGQMDSVEKQLSRLLTILDK